MPELPEVEVTRRQIEPMLVERVIAEVHTTRQSYFFLTPPARLRARLRGRRAVRLDRLGKYLVALIDDGARLLLHLGMTGQVFAEGAWSVRLVSAERRSTLAPEAQPRFRPDAHTHLAVSFEDGGPRLFVRDVRKLGKVRLLEPGDREERLDKLGPDALGVTGPLLEEAARGRRVPIKALLLDQSALAGVGNIYADEALFAARISPLRPAHAVKRAELLGLAAAVRAVLERAIERGGSSIDDFVNPDGSDGGFQTEHRVYGRQGEPCVACATPLTRVVIGQRSSCYCRKCQR